jgi:5'-nucleotidase
MSRRRLAYAALSIALGVALGAPPATGASPAAKKKPTLKILVTNDDGVEAPGIDALVEALRALPRVKVTVVGPASNQSGTSDKTTPGSLATRETTTVSGYPAIGVEGYPADSVNVALDSGLVKKPHLVISGVNEGQNLGELTDVSGTVGAARTAARRGIPALAVSQGFGEPPDYELGAGEAVKWVREHRRDLERRTAAAGAALLENLNVPTCTIGDVRGLVEAPVAPTAENAAGPSDCASTLTDPVDDIQAFTNGFAVVSTLPLD